MGQLCKCPKSLSGSKREGSLLELAQRMGGYNLVLFYCCAPVSMKLLMTLLVC